MACCQAGETCQAVSGPFGSAGAAQTRVGLELVDNRDEIVETDDPFELESGAAIAGPDHVSLDPANHRQTDNDAIAALKIASTLERIGRLFSERGQLDDALMCLRAAYERYEGPQNQLQARQARPVVGHTLSVMADLYERKEDWRAACQMHARALDVRRAVLPPTSPLLADSLYGLGNARQRLKSPRAALQAYEEAEAIRRTAAGHGGGAMAPVQAVALGDVLVNMSRPLKALHRDAEAVARLQEAREVYTHQAGLVAGDPRVRTVTDNLRVLGALAGAKVGNGNGNGNGNGVGRAGMGSGGDRREKLLQHHARGTSSHGKPVAVAVGRRAASGTKKSGGCVVS